MLKEKVLLTVGLLLGMLFLGVADATLVEGWPGAPIEGIAAVPPVSPPGQGSNASDAQSVSALQGSGVALPGGGIPLNQGADVLSTLVAHNFTFEDPTSIEKIVLDRVAPQSEATVEKHVLLLDGDRAGVIAWVESPKVKDYFLKVKEVLHGSFTTKVQDLIDETQRRENLPVRNLLTFFDPGLLPERVVFVRVRQRLFEIHIADGKSKELFDLIEELTQ